MLRTPIARLGSQLPLVYCKRSKYTNITKWMPLKTAFGTFFKKHDALYALPDSVEHATGNAKAELQLAEMGIIDPWYENGVDKLNAGLTKDDPHLILIMKPHDERIVACLCEPEQTHLCYTSMRPGELKRCECGLWMKGVQVHSNIDYVDQYI